MAVRMDEGTLKLLRAGDVGDLSDIDSAAIAFGAGSAETLSALQPVIEVMGECSENESMGEMWMELADELPQRIIAAQVEQRRGENFERMVGVLRSWHTAPIYAVLSAKKAELAPGMQEQLLASLTAQEGAQAAEQGAWKGVKLALHADGDLLEQFSVLQQMQIQDALKGMPLYIMTQVRDNSLVVVVCSDPQQAQLPEGTAQSVLAGAGTAFMGAHAKPLAALSLEPNLYAALNNCRMSPTRTMTGLCSGVFKTMAEQDAASRPLYQTAVQAVDNIARQLETLSPAETRPVTLLAWSDDKLHIEMESDAHGMVMQPAATPEVNSPNTILSVRADRCVGGTVHLDWPTLLTSCEQLADGMAATLEPESRFSAQSAMAQYRLFSNEAAQFGQAFSSWSGALDGSFALAIQADG